MSDSPPFIRDDVKAVLDLMATLRGTPLPDLPLEQARKAFEISRPIMEADPRPLAVIRDLACPGPGGDIPLRLYDARAEREAGPLIVFYHGGGFVIGDLDSHHNFCTAIAEAMDLPVVAVDYRLAPEHPFPAAADDAEAATRWLGTSPAELSRQVTGLIPMGDSAGGNLAIVVTQDLQAKPAAVPVVLQVPIYPCAHARFDGMESFSRFGAGFMLDAYAMNWFFDCYAAAEHEVRAYPILGDLSNTPPTVLITAGLDPIRDSGRTYAAALIANGRDVTYMEFAGTIHGFVNLRKALPSANEDVARLFAAMKQALGR